MVRAPTQRVSDLTPSPSGPLNAPGADPQDQGNGGPGGGFASPSEPNDSGDSTALVMRLVQTINSASRRLGLMYPAALEEVRSINGALMRMQKKIVNTKPAVEPMAPPV